MIDRSLQLKRACGNIEHWSTSLRYHPFKHLFTMPNKRASPFILTLPKPGESMKRGEDGSDTIETLEFDMCVHPDILRIHTIPLTWNSGQF